MAATGTATSSGDKRRLPARRGFHDELGRRKPQAAVEIAPADQEEPILLGLQETAERTGEIVVPGDGMERREPGTEVADQGEAGLVFRVRAAVGQVADHEHADGVRRNGGDVLQRLPEMAMTQFGPGGIFDIWESERITGDPLRSDYLRMD